MLKSVSTVRLIRIIILSLFLSWFPVVPSQALVATHSLTIDSVADSITLGDSATASLTHSFVNLGSRYDSVSIFATVVSSNASTAGTIMLSVTDSYTNIANDASASNSPRYSFGNSSYIDSFPFSVDSTTIRGLGTNFLSSAWPDSPTQAAGGYQGFRVRDQSQFFLTENFVDRRDSITITSGATDSTTLATASRTLGTQLELKLYNPSAAGTYTVKVYTLASNAGAALTAATPEVTWTVTVTAPSATATADSTVTLRHGDVVRSTTASTYFSGTAEGGDSSTVQGRSTSTTTTTPGFSLIVKQKNGTSTNTAAESYTVQVSGEAWITAGTQNVGATKGAAAAAETRPTSATGVKWLQMATPVADSATAVRVWSTGTAGTATITVTTASGLLIGTKTVTFSGPVTTLTVSRDIKKVLQAGTGDAISSVFNVSATDAGGRAVLNVNPTIVSSNLNAISGGTCTDAVGAVSDGTSVCSVTGVALSTSGMAVTLTARTLNPAGNLVDEYLTVTYAVTMGGAVSTVVLTTDKATYEPGEAMVVTATAKDSSGNTPYDGQSGPTLRSNKALGGAAAGTTITMNDYYDGVSTSKTRSTPVRTILANDTLFAPAASGKFTISGLDGQTTPAAISVTATVSDDGATAAASAATDAALEAIDAANAATDAANLAAEAADAATVAAEEARDAADAATAAVEALATEVATLMAALKAQITTLANTVAKIAKKVKA